jgi:hypothetical protein
MQSDQKVTEVLGDHSMETSYSARIYTADGRYICGVSSATSLESLVANIKGIELRIERVTRPAYVPALDEVLSTTPITALHQ